MQQVNQMAEEEFVSVFGGVFENSPHIARLARHAGPFRDLARLHQALCLVVERLSVEAKEALIGAHPDLVGRAALMGTLSAESTREQASAGLDNLTGAEVARFGELNHLYRSKFGFPFVICARENKKESILAGMEARLPNSREREIDTAMREIGKIAWLRLLDLVEDNGEEG
ncbi:MAG: 2-oxo-4-hydroxy-4-carboxy-5-ureidoimidazoline decarboxylase [Chloroflexia bacterium]